MTAASSELALRVVATDAATDPRWDRFVDAHPDGNGHLHSRWLESLRAETGTEQHHLVCEAPDGELVGVLPLVVTRGLPGGGQLTAARLASLPRTPTGGPLVRDRRAGDALVRTAIELADDRGLPLQLKSAGDGPAWTHLGVARVPWRTGYVVPLVDDRDEFAFAGPRHGPRLRRSVRRAEGAGLRFRRCGPEALGDWYPLYLDAMRWHAVPPRPRRFFESLLAPGGPAVLNLVESTKGPRRVVSGSVDLRWSQTASYLFNGVDRSRFADRPVELLLWSAIRLARADGARWYDLGEVSASNEGLRHFKQKWGAEEVALWHHHRGTAEHPTDDEPLGGPVGGAVRRAWRRVPLAVTARVGELVNARL